MLFLEIFAVALSSLRANKFRSFLTMLGIVIGIAAVIAMVALGTGAQRSVRERIASLGTTLLEVNTMRIAQGGVQLNDFKRMTIDDVRMIEETATHVAAVQPSQDKNFQVTYLNRNTNVQITGATPNFLAVQRFDIDVGRMFTHAEDEAHSRVAVLGSAVLPYLAIDSPEAIVGENIRIRGVQFQVIGVFKSKGRASAFGNPDEQIVIPFQTGRFRIFGTDRLNDIEVLASSEEAIPDAMAEIAQAMRRSHKLAVGKPDDFRIRDQADFLNTMGETTQVFTYLLAGVAAVSLLVGGIGIMNIMLVAVTERTREIGVRKALGATRRNILLQFLLEAVVLCLAGGVIGVIVGAGGAIILRRSFGWNTDVAPYSVALAFGFSALVGLVFGVWPAKRAAVLDPIEALRYE